MRATDAVRRGLLCASVPLCLGASPLRSQQRTVDVQSYHFRIDLPDSGNHIDGLATVLFTTKRGYDDTLRLDLVGMQVRRVFDVNNMEQLPFRHDGTVLRVATRTMVRKQRMGVVVEYGGEPRDGLIIRTNARGRRSIFGDNWPNRARFWLPTIDHPSDKARVLWSIQVPAGWRGIANMPECRPQPRVCNESAPIPTYTMVLGATEMTTSVHRPARIARDPVTGRTQIPIEVWTYPEDSAFADSVPFARATEIVEAGSRIIGPFPFAKLSHVQSSTRYGGMENSTEIFYAENPYVRRSMREGVVRHETAHQWFGDAVTPADWHHVWLSEGFATYFDLVIGAALSGDTLLQAGMRRAAETVKNSEVISRPIIDTGITDPNQELSANSYQKGAWVLHMLRGLVGDSAFFAGIRDYYRVYRDSSVLTTQFQRVMERSSGRRLEWFFGQWLRQPGFPRLDVAWRSDGAGHVRVEVAQLQQWGRFTIPNVPIDFLKNGQVFARRFLALQPQQNSQVVEFDLGDVPDAVAIDADGTLLLTADVRGLP